VWFKDGKDKRELVKDVQIPQEKTTTRGNCT
jgi:hypothetical protein